MISSIKGTVSLIGDSYIVLDCNGVGFQISMPATDIYKLSEGMEVRVCTHLSVREDDLSLYGFLGNDELYMFKQLITVSGIGPKGALSIMSSISVDELKMAIAAGDAKLISGFKGIGLKTAQKLVVDLKGKFKDVIPSGSTQTRMISNNNIETAVMFVESTGISRSQCMKALGRSELSDNANVDEIIDLIFKNLNI